MTNPLPGHRSGSTLEVSGEDFLVVEDLSVRFPTHDGLVQAVSNLSYSVRMGETLARECKCKARPLRGRRRCFAISRTLSRASA